MAADGPDPAAPAGDAAEVRRELAAGRFTAAESAVDAWLRRDPASSEALRHKALLLRLRGLDAPGSADADLRRRVLVQESRAAAREADELSARGDLRAAVVRLETAAACLRAALPWEDASRELEAVAQRLGTMRSAADEARLASARSSRDRALFTATAVRDARAGDADLAFAERATRIRSLLARDLAELALDHARALVRDHPFAPHADEAQTLFDLCLRRVHELRGRDLAERERELRSEVFRRVELALIPSGYDGLPDFPDDFARRRSGRTGVLDPAPESAVWEDALRDRLAQRISVDFNGLSAVDAFARLAQLTGINLVVDAKVQATGDQPITLVVRSMRLDGILTWITGQIGVPWTVANGAVVVGTAETAPATLRIYDASALVVAAPEPQVLTVGFSAAGGGAGVGATDLFTPAQDAGGTALTAADLVEMIRASVAVDAWAVDGNAIEARGNQLLVQAPPSVHAMLVEFLRAQERIRSVGVRVQARWLTLTDRYAEEIGVRWSGAGLVADPGGNPSGAFRDFRTGNTRATTDNQLPGTAMSLSPALAGTGLSLDTAVAAPWQVHAMLSAVERTQQGRALIAPEVTVLNGQRGYVYTGQQVAYIGDYSIAGGGGGRQPLYDPQIDIVNTGGFLSVKPIVSADRKYVTIDVHAGLADLEAMYTEYIESLAFRQIGSNIQNEPIYVFDNPIRFPLELPTVALRETRTYAQLADRGSLVIAGFGQHIEQNALARVPFAGAIPYLGRLFGARGRYSDRSQLYLLVTATIIPYDELESRL